MTQGVAPAGCATTPAPAARPLFTRGRLIALGVLFVLSIVAGGLYFGLLGGPRLSDEALTANVSDALAVMRAQWDPRLYVFEVAVAARRGTVTLSGTVDGLKRDEVLGRVSALTGVRKVDDRMVRLPDPALGTRTAGLVSAAVANLGDAPGQAEGKDLVTQARLGDPLDILRGEGGWYLVRMRDDGYLGWLAPTDLVRLEPQALAALLEGDQVLITAKLAEVSASPGEPILTAVMGTVLPLRPEGLAGAPEGYLPVTLPTGEPALVREDCARQLPSAVAVLAQKGSAVDIIALAEQYVGLAYLWGGTTSYGFDCSGFVQFVFGMNGYALPRDADMQYTVGTPVADRSQLGPGDLVFFSTYKAGPSHVGIYVGDSRYIQSGSGGLAIRSFDPAAPDYSSSLDKAYLGARRVIEAGR